MATIQQVASSVKAGNPKSGHIKEAINEFLHVDCGELKIIKNFFFLNARCCSKKIV